MEHLRPHPAAPATSLGARAASDLSFIRATLERSGRFTAVSGAGGVLMGAIGGTAALASPVAGDDWPLVWLVAAAVAAPANAWMLARKARRQGQSILRGRGPAFWLALLPPMVAGAVLTGLLLGSGRPDLLPAVWLLLYGAGIATGGSTSIPLVPLIGAAFMSLGAVAACAPASFGLPLLAAGFGGLHVGFGIWIGVRHGG